MKRRTHRHSHRRVSRPAVFKQQVKRKEARKLAKYPLKTVYVLTQGFISLRIEVHNMPNTTSTYEPLVLVDTADLPEEEWLEYRRRGSAEVTPLPF